MKNRSLTACIITLLIASMTAGCGMQKEAVSELKNMVSSKLQSYEAADAVVEETCMETGSYMSGAAPMSAAAVDGEAYCYEPAYIEPDWSEPDWNTEEYSYEEENPFFSAMATPFSTFAADVDTASYANVRRMILGGEDVTPDAVRAEEMINYFRYAYDGPAAGEPFGVTTELAPCPWNDEAQLLLIGLQAEKPDTSKMPASNLVFLIDVSGSMTDSNKLPLVKRSFLTLMETLSDDDRVTLITYADGEQVLCEGVKGSEKATVMSLLESLEAGGATDGQHALEMAYEAAEENYIEGGNNRIILATDGDFNVGITSEGDLTRYIKEKTDSGICLSVLGYGMGNYKDNKMEAIADNGNGNYYYIDDIAEARKVLVEEAGGTLFTVAKDVKLQVEFNPAMVKGYRLIGYENRTMAAEDFSDDTKDGGELGAGHQVTALYEVIPAESDFPVPEVTSRYQTSRSSADIDDQESKETENVKDSAAADNEIGSEWLTVNIRYKAPDGNTSKLLEYPVNDTSFREEMSDNMSWAAGVAQTAMLLKDSAYAGTSSYEDVKDRLKDIADDDYREEFLYLLTRLAR
ncbi:MAG: VWA domain-containing protein [Eubacterium sp.]|nr:VWA domain-containing protein [Eubacterium sp.]